MKAQEAAKKILVSMGEPMSSRDIAEIAIKEGMVRSNSKNPKLSISGTIEKNIREGIYNDPELVFIGQGHNRLIGLPDRQSETSYPHDPHRTISISISTEMVKKVNLVSTAKNFSSLEDSVVYLVKEGLRSIWPEIKTILGVFFEDNFEKSPVVTDTCSLDVTKVHPPRPTRRGRKPIKGITLFGENYRVGSWSEVMMKVTEQVYLRHKNDFHRCEEIKSRGGRMFFSRNSTDLDTPHRISDSGYHCETKLNSSYMKKQITRLLEYFGYDRFQIKYLE